MQSNTLLLITEAFKHDSVGSSTSYVM